MCTCGAKLKSTTVRIIYLLSVLLNVITVYTVQVVTKICYNNHWSLTFLRLFEIDDLQWHSVLRSSFECWFFSRNNRSILFNLSSQSLMDQLILFFGVLMPKQILKEWYPYTSQLFYPLRFFLKRKKTTDPMIHRESEGVWFCEGQPRQHMTSPIGTRIIGGRCLTGVGGWTRVPTNRRGALCHVESSVTRLLIAGSKQLRKRRTAAK